jgi:hypothetical protein
VTGSVHPGVPGPVQAPNRLADIPDIESIGELARAPRARRVVDNDDFMSSSLCRAQALEATGQIVRAVVGTDGNGNWD